MKLILTFGAWASSDESLAKVDASTGALSIIGLGSGSVIISAQSASGIVASTPVYLVNPGTDTYTITQPGTVLENCTFKNLTIAAGVGTGEVTLINVVADKLIVLGGGRNSVTRTAAVMTR